MKYSIWLCLLCFFFASTADAIVAPRNGGSLPQAYYDAKTRDEMAFRLTRAWIQKLERVRVEREAFVRSGSTAYDATQFAIPKISGTFSVPVLLGAYVNQPASFAPDSLQKELFSGPWPTGTMADYFAEVSYGVLNVTGVVTDWVTTFQQDFYYVGASNGMTPNDAKTGEFIKELLDANDGAIDFGEFDNDGPDGVPNSGDDDGYVDFAVFVHSASGGECDEFSYHMYSHSWVYRGWPISGGTPYTTNDASALGGNIKIDDYVIQPAKSCVGGIIEIGGFCHEFGHALGLPDLSDPDGGSSGAGHWDLMASGNWNTPQSPAHLSAWSRKELGWVIPTVVTWEGSVQLIPQIATNPLCFELRLTDDRFIRASECALAGSYSLRCGIGAAEAASRNWPGGSGYGNLWHQSIERSFQFDGSLPVSVSYRYAHELEPVADSAVVYVTVGGSRTMIASYTGNGSGTENIDLAPYLTAVAPPEEYVIEFCVTSDGGWSDEDGKHLTNCGAFIVDDLDVTGGGENYSTDFESSTDGWYQDPSKNPATEYWLVENRQPVGFDSHLHSPGLLIWHVDDEVIRSAIGNSGGAGNATVRGLVLEEADGMGHLVQDPETTGNAGDAGDSYPGSTGNTAFDGDSNPNSDGNSAHPTLIEVSGIGASSSTMSAFLCAADAAPTASSVVPDVVNNDMISISIQATGTDIQPGAFLRLTRTGEADIVPASVYWNDTETLVGDFNVYSKKGGLWDAVIENPDGQQVILENALTIVQIVSAQLVSVVILVNEDNVELVFEIYERGDDESFDLSRSLVAAGPWIPLDVAPVEVRDGVFRFVDSTVETGHVYHYKLRVRSGDNGTRELYRGSVEVPASDFILDQNFPNPFNPTTTIIFSLPKQSLVTLKIYDVSGALVRTLVSETIRAGTHKRDWDGRDDRGSMVGSGIYFYRLKAGTNRQTRKMVLTK